MKKYIIILGLVSCSQNREELFREIESDTMMAQDTMISAFANQLKGISKSIQIKNVHHQKSKDSLANQLKKMHSKTKALQNENNFYIDAINGYSDIIMRKDIQDAYWKSTKDTTK